MRPHCTRLGTAFSGVPGLGHGLPFCTEDFGLAVQVIVLLLPGAFSLPEASLGSLLGLLG